MKDCIDVQDAAFRGLPSGRSIHRPRVDLYYPCERDDGYFRWGTMEGANGDFFAIRMKSDIVTWPRDAQRQRHRRKVLRPAGDVLRADPADFDAQRRAARAHQRRRAPAHARRRRGGNRREVSLARGRARRRDDRLRRHGAHVPRGVRCVRDIRRARSTAPAATIARSTPPRCARSSGSRSSRSTSARAAIAGADIVVGLHRRDRPGLRSGVARAGDARDQPQPPRSPERRGGTLRRVHAPGHLRARVRRRPSASRRVAANRRRRISAGRSKS